MKKGSVKFFNDSKGFGFIIPEDSNEDIFVYRSDIKKNEKGLRTLTDDQKVEFLNSISFSEFSEFSPFFFLIS